MLDAIAFALTARIAFSYEDGTMVATAGGYEVTIWEHPENDGIEKVFLKRGDVTEVFGPDEAIPALSALSGH